MVEDSPSSLDVPYYSSAVFSFDGRFVATSHRDGMVRIWDVHVGRLMRRLRVPHANWQTSIRFMPDGKGLVTGGRDKTLKYWDISTIGRSPTVIPLREGVEEQVVPEREFLGHKVRRISLVSLSMIRTSVSRVLFSPLPFRLMADGLSLALVIKVFVFGTLGMQQSDVSSRMPLIGTCSRLILVQQAVILLLEEMMVWSEFGDTLGAVERISYRFSTEFFSFSLSLPSGFRSYYHVFPLFVLSYYFYKMY